MAHFHTIVWIDHRAAHVFGFGREGADRTVVRHQDAPEMIHRKSGPRGPGHEHEDKAYLDAVAAALGETGEILITGPGHARTELKTHLETHHPDVFNKVVGVEALDHPSDGELLAFAEKYFRAKDRMIPPR